MRKTLRNYALVASMLLASVASFGQSRITGTVVDAENGEGLPGASVVLKGTTNGTITDFNGDFSLTVEKSTATIVISFVGFQTVERTINLSETQSLGKIELAPGANELSPLEVIASVAVDRKTPVAVSTIKRAVIEENASNQEFPELLKSTPGVYATKQGGGYGDSRINVRGFNDENVAVLINGVPVNDMENGNIYWSNWAGLTDVTTTMQVQRGLGASKVAVPSIGGTINIITKTTDLEKGGNVYQGFGNNGYLKTSFSLNTGLTENNWAISVSGAKITGDGWADGTQFVGYNYFMNISKVLNDKHTLSFTGFGAPQVHGQRQNMHSIAKFREAPQGLRYNADWGVLNGDVVNVEDNFYHKPQFSLNHYWTISNKSELSTAVYYSTGTGGGGGYATEEDAVTGFEPTFNNYRTGGTYSPYDLDAIVDLNQTSSDGRALGYLRASRNDHRWYGVLSTYTQEINDNIDILAGLDGRFYKGIHFSEVYDLLGAEYVYDDNNMNNPNAALNVGDKRDYYNDGLVGWAGAFLQGEYSSGPLAAFLTLSASNTSYQRIDYFQYAPEDQATPWQNFFGYQVKGGANYNLNRNHNVFANVGYFEKAPDFDAVFQNFRNDINSEAENQKILSYELGYGYRSPKFSGNVNLYRTGWNDRTFTKSFQGDDDKLYYANILGVNALHQGVEIDFTYTPVKALKVIGMLSLGDWTWSDDVNSVNVFDEQQNIIETIDQLYIADIKVGGSAQTTGALGIDYNIIPAFKVGVLYTYFSKFYADYDPTNRTSSEIAGIQAWEVPTYGLLDVKARYDFKIGDLDANLFVNANNLFDVEYISDAQDTNSTAAGASVFYGVGRTWTTGLKINF
ncbi:TonB-dependent receptor domain-containing protein [Marinoscillum sp. 108]|uniref:TonB-dependent receptor n=1 Tax=Marinoscillum sp. 108 TaxID=2653151 RepID=UPI0012F16B2D|nr:TonB-dependent receptor [Marinoscillum sp. 108]VXD12971.1 TonB-dependent receptor [Marinoscillum sp. 108]